MLNRGDVININLAARKYCHGVSEEDAFLVLDERNTEALVAPVVFKVTKGSSRKYSTFLTRKDFGCGDLQNEGSVVLNDVFRVDKNDCKKIGTIKGEKLDEVLRLFVKYAASIHFDYFHKRRKSHGIPASGKVIDENDLFSVVDASLDMWLTAGRFAKEFEEKLPDFIGAKHCALVNSGSSANLLALSALTSYKLGNGRLRPRDEVITVAAGFPTTVTPIIQNNLVPVFADVEIGTYNVDPELLEKAISKRTRAIFVAHALGNPFDVERILNLAAEHDLWLVEDSCDALGSKYNSQYTGTFGDISTFSFYPAHQITMGEGGAVVTSDSRLHGIVSSMRDWGRDCWCPPGKENTCGKRFEWRLGTLPQGYDHKYIYSHLGYNLKATDFQAALGLSQLSKLPVFVRKRKENFRLLYDGFKKLGLDELFILPRWLPKSDPSWFGFPLTIKEKIPFQRRTLIEFLEKRGIGTRLLFAGNIIRQPAFTETRVKARVVGELKNTEKICKDTFWIGVWPGISEEDIAYMLESFCAFSKGIENC